MAATESQLLGSGVDLGAAGRAPQLPAFELGLRERRSGSPSGLTSAKARSCHRDTEWAHGRVWPISVTRDRALASFLRFYNRRRPHSAAGGRPPITRVHHLRGQGQLDVSSR